MNAFTLIVFFGLSASTSPAEAAGSPSARDIMVRYEAAIKVPQFTAQATLTSVKKDGTTKEKVFTIWRKIKPAGARYQSLIRFSAPSEVKNEAILFSENDQGANDILLYLPAYQKTRRIERTQQSSSFMGTDFSYSDLTTPHVEDFNYSLKKEEPCPSEPKATCSKIEGDPISDSIREQTGYSKSIWWVRKADFMVVQSDHMDLAGAFVKRILISEYEKLPSGKYFQKRVEVTHQKDQGKTTLRFADLKTTTKIEDSIFTQQSLGKGLK